MVIVGGLRRGFEHHAGAQLCVCDESADVAPGPATQLAQYRRYGGKGLRALGGLQHADLYMMRACGCHVTGEFIARDNVAPTYHNEAPVTPNREPEKIILLPFVYAQERGKIAERLALRCLLRRRQCTQRGVSRTIRLGWDHTAAAHTTP